MLILARMYLVLAVPSFVLHSSFTLTQQSSCPGLLYFSFLFLISERGKEGAGRGRNNDQLPPTGTRGWNLPLQGIEPIIFWDMVTPQPTEPYQPGPGLLFVGWGVVRRAFTSQDNFQIIDKLGD